MIPERWNPIPDWFSSENQDADLAVGDVDGDGELDLVVLMVDNPPGKNQGKYRIGRRRAAASRRDPSAITWPGRVSQRIATRRRPTA